MNNTSRLSMGYPTSARLVKHHIKIINGKNHMVISIDTGNPYDIMIYPFITKIKLLVN